MPKTTAAITAELTLIFCNTDWANIGDAGGLQGSSTPGSFYVSLHTASPGVGGSQNTSEATYTPYARQAIARSAAGFTVAGVQVTNAAIVYFPTCTSGSDTITHWGIGTDLTGAGNLLRYGPISGAFCGFTAALSDDITIPGHTLILDDRVVFYAGEADETFPTGLTQGTVYWVVSASGDSVQVSTTQGGTPANITAIGAGICAEVTPFAVSAAVGPFVAIGGIVIKEH